jgi:hypothetical protein
MRKLTHDEVLEMLQQTLIYKRIPENLKPILMTSVMDMADEMQAEISLRNVQEPDDAFYERGLQMWKNLGLDKVA